MKHRAPLADWTPIPIEKRWKCISMGDGTFRWIAKPAAATPPVGSAWIGYPGFPPTAPDKQKEAEEDATAYRKDFAKKTPMGDVVTAITPHTECDNCKNGVHRFLVHQGPRLLCQMASCNCKGFKAKPEPKEPVFA